MNDETIPSGADDETAPTEVNRPDDAVTPDTAPSDTAPDEASDSTIQTSGEAAIIEADMGGGPTQADGPDTDTSANGRQARLKELEREGDIAADYLEELLDIADLDGDLDMDVEGDRAAVSIVGSGLDALVGEDGQVLEALQELTRLAVYRETGERSRLMLDIGGYRADIRRQLLVLAGEAIDEVQQTGEAVKLAPMSPFERKIIHDAVSSAGLTSESEGVEPTRSVVILPSA